jgi:triosephosphate isomerase
MAVKKLIAANFKMNKTIGELRTYLDQFLRTEIDFGLVDVVIAPPMTGLSVVSERIGHSPLMLSAQNVYHEPIGSYTGEVSLGMLSDVGCDYVILGHSERRTIFGETNELINKKVRATLLSGIRPILCIGETLRERELGLTHEILKTQIAEGLE